MSGNEHTGRAVGWGRALCASVAVAPSRHYWADAGGILLVRRRLEGFRGKRAPCAINSPALFRNSGGSNGAIFSRKGNNVAATPVNSLNGPFRRLPLLDIGLPIRGRAASS